ncbi:hypothetical protein D3C80_1275020 [compost metagenome]
MREDHQCTEEHRAQAGQHHGPVDARQAGAIHLRSADDRRVDATQAGKEHGHDEARSLPHGRDHQAIHHPVGIDQPVQAKALPAPVTQQLVQAHAGVEQPLPGGTGDDHRQRHGVQVNGADEALATDALVQQHRQQHTDGQADGDEQAAEQKQVLARHPPAVVVEQTGVLRKARPLVGGQKGRGGEGQHEGPEDVAVEAHQDDEHAGCQHQLGQPALKRVQG